MCIGGCDGGGVGGCKLDCRVQSAEFGNSICHTGGCWDLFWLVNPNKNFFIITNKQVDVLCQLDAAVLRYDDFLEYFLHSELCTLNSD